jgi:hypothetical protein
MSSMSRADLGTARRRAISDATVDASVRMPRW